MGLNFSLDIVFGLDMLCWTEMPNSICVKSFIELLCATGVFIINNED